MSSVDPRLIRERYGEIRERVRAAAGARADEITLVAVSKKQPVEAIQTLYELGHRDFGENYAQELAEKAEELKRRGCWEIRWHFIGHLQTNKAKMIVPHVTTVHSVDSLKLGTELAKRWRAAGRDGRLPVFVEVNVDQQESKVGVVPETVPSLVRELATVPELVVQGLMCIPDPERGPSGEPFERLRWVSKECGDATAGQLSMGMTDDFEVALAHGATHIRIGTAIFGPRV